MASHSFRSSNVKIAHKAPMLGTTATPDKAAYYVFNAGTANGGFVIVAGDDRVPAILGYSDRGAFDASDVPPVLQEWLDGYASQMQAISIGAAPDVRSSVGAPIAPMLNVNWGQGMPYNVLLPHVPGSSNAHAYVGCVAVAMAQVMSYWQYPTRATKTIPGYTSYPGRTYQTTLSTLTPMDFDWENMQNTYYTNDSTSTECMAVANLMLYSTTALQSSFNLTATNSYTRKIPETLIEYFGYKNSAHYVYRENFSTQAWEELIYAELAAGRPVAYGGNKQSAGHAFVCDGYDGEGLFHINWGWAGKSNGYFLLNLLNPSAEGIGSAAGAYGYVKGQGAAIGLMPDDGTDGEAAFSFEDLSIASTNTTRSSASSNFSVNVSGKFVNNTNVTSQFRQGWGLYDSDGELVEVLFTRYTTSALGNGEYISVSSRALNFGAGITSGTYRILPIYSIYPSEDYKPCIGSDVNYIEVTFGGTYSCTIKGYGTAGSTTKYTVNNCTIEGTLNHGKPVTVTLNLQNAGTSTNDLIYMFVDGTFNAMGLANIAAGESGDLVYRFTPTSAGSKTLTFSLNEDGTSPFYTKKVTISTMPGASLDVSYRILNITDEENRIITADHYTIIADITNTGTTTYNEDFSVRLYRINNNETNVGTELLNQTQPLVLPAGESTSLQFDFDHDLVDGWRYFCYLYYYSAGETVSTGTRWYTINFPTGPVETHLVNAVVNPAEGGVITFASGVNDGEAQVGKTVSFTVTPADGYIISEVQAVDANDETVNLNYNANTGRYSFVMPSSDVTITATALASHQITVEPNIEYGGRATLSTAVATAGETVTINASPNVGWTLAGVNVRANGSNVPMTYVGDGVYTFVMPDYNTTVNVIFERVTGHRLELVETRSKITEGGIYVIASKYYDKALKFHQQGEETFGSTDVIEWLNEDKSIMRVNEETCLIQMMAVNPDTIRHGATSGARTNAFLSYGNGYLTTSNGNLIVSEACTDLCRAGMFISTNESNFLVRFFNEATGASSDYMTVRYDYNGDKFRILNYSSDNQQRVWLYKLVDAYRVTTVCAPEEAATIELLNFNVENTVQAGETVTFAVTPNGEYTIGEVTVTTVDGETIIPEVNDEEGYYHFTMPTADVTITVTMEEPQGPDFIVGDVNGDGAVTIRDVTDLIDYLLGSPVEINFDAADVVQDGAIAIGDVTTLIDMLLTGTY